MEENKLINFLSKHWSKMLLGILALATIAVWSQRMLGNNKNQSRQDFFEAQLIYEKFQKGALLASEDIESSKNILKRHPELRPKFEAMLALNFFSQAKSAEAIPYTQFMLQQADHLIPSFYKEYAQTTLLISKENYTEAYQAALSLQDKLAPQEDYQNLHAMNTLRLAILADCLGEQDQKKIFWNQLEKLPTFSAIDEVFHEGNVSLTDYMCRPLSSIPLL